MHFKDDDALLLYTSSQRLKAILCDNKFIFSIIFYILYVIWVETITWDAYQICSGANTIFFYTHTQHLTIYIYIYII